MTIHDITLGSRISAKDLAEIGARVNQKLIKAVPIIQTSIKERKKTHHF